MFIFFQHKMSINTLKRVVIAIFFILWLISTVFFIIEPYYIKEICSYIKFRLDSTYDIDNVFNEYEIISWSKLFSSNKSNVFYLPINKGKFSIENKWWTWIIHVYSYAPNFSTIFSPINLIPVGNILFGEQDKDFCLKIWQTSTNWTIHWALNTNDFYIHKDNCIPISFGNTPIFNYYTWTFIEIITTSSGYITIE